MIYDAVIIGGGASGLFCAAQLGRRGRTALVVEHSDRCGKKLLITGKGRCNVTNNCDADTVMRNIPRNPRFMYSSLYRFPPADVMSYFGSLGVALKTERGGRVFPESDRASDIAEALLRDCRKGGVSFVTDHAEEVILRDGAACGVRCSSGEYLGRNVIVAAGGCSYPGTGSAGDGYRLAEAAGHSIVPITPSLCPIVTAEREECAEAMGLSLKNCTLTLRKEGAKKPVFSELGELLFTHFGLSGPLVLSASAHLEDLNREKYYMDIDLKPGLDHGKLDMRIRRDWGEMPGRNFSNSLGRLLPAKLIPVIVRRSGIPPEKKVSQITREERIRLADTIKKLTYTVRSMRPVEYAIITRGGVKVSEVDPGTMGSRLRQGLYFIGEVLDVDAYTGGFNLQIAFSTAYACAYAVSDRCGGLRE